MAILCLAVIEIRGGSLASASTSSQQFTAPSSANNESKSSLAISEPSLTSKLIKSS